MSYLILTIPGGQFESNIVRLTPGKLIGSIFIPDDIIEDDQTGVLKFNGFLSDDENSQMGELNFSFDLNSTDPEYRGKVTTNIQGLFTGLNKLQAVVTVAPAQKVDIILGWI